MANPADTSAEVANLPDDFFSGGSNLTTSKGLVDAIRAIAGDVVSVFLGELDILTEDLTIFVDPAIAEDPIPVSPIRTQAEATTAGPFKTIDAAVNALPPVIPYEVTISVADCDAVLTPEFLGDYTRFSFQSYPGTGHGFFLTGSIVITPTNGLVRVVGTSAMGVQSQNTIRKITLDADPGLGDDAFQGYLLRVVSGTGAGQARAIHTHNDAAKTFNTCGVWSPSLDGTSVVEVVAPAARMKTHPDAFGFPSMVGPGSAMTYAPQVVIKEMHIWSDIGDGAGYFAPDRISLHVFDCMMKLTGMYATDSEIVCVGGSWDGNGSQGILTRTNVNYPGVIACGGKSLVYAGAFDQSGRGLFIYNTTGAGVSCGFVSEWSASAMWLSGIVFFDIDESAAVCAGRGNFLLHRRSRDDNPCEGFTVGRYGYEVMHGAYLNVPPSTFPVLQVLDGTLGDFFIDESLTTYAALNAAGTVVGARQSAVSALDLFP